MMYTRYTMYTPPAGRYSQVHTHRGMDTHALLLQPGCHSEAEVQDALFKNHVHDALFNNHVHDALFNNHVHDALMYICSTMHLAPLPHCDTQVVQQDEVQHC